MLKFKPSSVGQQQKTSKNDNDNKIKNPILQWKMLNEKRFVSFTNLIVDSSIFLLSEKVTRSWKRYLKPFGLKTPKTDLGIGRMRVFIFCLKIARDGLVRKSALRLFQERIESRKKLFLYLIDLQRILSWMLPFLLP